MDDRRPFRLYLSSDSSARYYQRNTKTDFWVHLSNAIHLRGAWEVGITELFISQAEPSQDSALYVYSNISVQVPVSDSMIRLLRILPPPSDSATNTYVFDRPYFERVEFPEIQDIRFRLLDKNAEPYKLKASGVVTHIVLWFRPI